MTVSAFKKKIWDYYREHGRHDMAWRKTRDPYRILVSEIMLQQTQVSRVEGFYKNFIHLFPNFRALAKAKTPDVLLAWQGLGYNRRALALQKLSKEVLEHHRGHLPRDFETLIALPGIGKYTAGAIRAFAFNEPEIFLETNIRRVFIASFFPRREKVTDSELARYIERTLDRKKPREWYYALMDYGTMLGQSKKNANHRSAHYTRQSIFVGSDREIRGKIVRELLSEKKISVAALPKRYNEPREKITKIVDGLIKEGFFKKKAGFLVVSE